MGVWTFTQFFRELLGGGEGIYRPPICRDDLLPGGAVL